MILKHCKMLKFSLALFSAAVLSLGSTASADTFTGDGDGVSWEDPANWLAGAVPLNNGSDILIGADHHVVFDADTFAALLAAGNTQNATEYQIAGLLMGDSTSAAFNGWHDLTFDQGDGITVRATNSTVIGGSPDKSATLKIVSGITVLEGSRVRVGQAVGGRGRINVSGGELILGQGGLELSNPDGTGGGGTFTIWGGSLTTRSDVEIFDGGFFSVRGSEPTLIGIGSSGSLDGSWTQEDGGVLRLSLDAGGVTPIFIDEIDGVPGTGGDGVATFAAGSILDVYDLDGVIPNVWTTVLSAEGGIVGEPTLSAGSVNTGWESRVSGNNLEVRFTGSTTITLKGDVDLNGVVDFGDIFPFIAVLQSGIFQAEVDCNCDRLNNFEDIYSFIIVLQ